MCRNWIWDRGVSQVLGWYNWKSTCPSTFFLMCQETSLIYSTNWCSKYSTESFPMAFWEIKTWIHCQITTAAALSRVPNSIYIHFSFQLFCLLNPTLCLKWSESQACEWASYIQLQIFSLCCQRWCWNEIQCELYMACYLHACGNNTISYVIELNNGKSLVLEVFHIATAWNQGSCSDLLMLLGAIFK